MRLWSLVVSHSVMATGMLEAYNTTLEEDEEMAARWAPHTETLAAVAAYR